MNVIKSIEDGHNINDYVDIYDPIDKTLALKDHCALHPAHPWNKWRLHERNDKSEFIKSRAHGGQRFRNNWYDRKETPNNYHRIGAPASILLDKDNNFIAEEWIIKDHLHRLDGPALRNDYSNDWYLFGHKMSEKEHTEILSLYQELGDWQLAFALSTFEYYDEKFLSKAINEVMGGVI